jgi:hypothetical protein
MAHSEHQFIPGLLLFLFHGFEIDDLPDLVSLPGVKGVIFEGAMPRTR